MRLDHEALLHQDGVRQAWTHEAFMDDMIASRGPLAVVPLDAANLAWACDVVAAHFGSNRMVTRERVHDVAALPGLVALLDGAPVGHLAYRVDGAECEIVSLVATRSRRGVGRALVAAMLDRAAGLGAVRVGVVTTNDNRSAQRLYESCGFTLVARRDGAVTRARALKSEIPLVGDGGVRIEDELEYARDVE